MNKIGYSIDAYDKDGSIFGTLQSEFYETQYTVDRNEKNYTTIDVPTYDDVKIMLRELKRRWNCTDISVYNDGKKIEENYINTSKSSKLFESILNETDTSEDSYTVDTLYKAGLSHVNINIIRAYLMGTNRKDELDKEMPLSFWKGILKEKNNNLKKLGDALLNKNTVSFKAYSFMSDQAETYHAAVFQAKDVHNATDLFLNQIKNERIENYYIGNESQTDPMDLQMLPVFGNSDKYVTKWFCNSREDALNSLLKDLRKSVILSVE